MNFLKIIVNRPLLTIQLSGSQYQVIWRQTLLFCKRNQYIFTPRYLSVSRMFQCSWIPMTFWASVSQWWLVKIYIATWTLTLRKKWLQVTRIHHQVQNNKYRRILFFHLSTPLCSRGVQPWVKIITSPGMDDFFLEVVYQMKRG